MCPSTRHSASLGDMHRKGRVVLEQEYGVNMCEALLTAGNPRALSSPYSEILSFSFQCMFIHSPLYLRDHPRLYEKLKHDETLVLRNL